MHESSNPTWLKKALDEKREELQRCHKILETMIEAYDAIAESSTKQTHKLEVQQSDIDYLWSEIRKLQEGLRTSNEWRQYFENRLADYRHYVEALRSSISQEVMPVEAWPVLSPRTPPERKVSARFSGRGVPQPLALEKQCYYGLDTPESGIRWGAQEMIHLGGWCCDAQGRAAKSVWVAVDNRTVPCSLGWKRNDVVKSFAKDLRVEPHCGFNVEIESRPGANFLRIWAEFQSGAKQCLMHRTIVVSDSGKRQIGQLDQNYAAWVEMFDTLTDQKIAQMEADIARMREKPLISVLLPTYNTDERWLSEVIESVRSQIYPHWQLCIADDASPKPHVREILKHYAALDDRICYVIREENGHISAATNSALELAKGSFCALLDHDDLLPRQALYHIAACIARDPEVDLIYSDEDKVDEQGVRFDPYFKSGWNPELFLSHNCVSHLGVYRTSILRKIGGFQEDLSGSQDWDLALRFIVEAGERGIRHIPKILYHWRYLDTSTSKSIESKPYAVAAGRRGIQNYLASKGDLSEVLPGTWAGSFRVKPHLSRATTVSIILLDYDAELSHACMQSVLSVTDHSLFEIVLLDSSNPTHVDSAGVPFVPRSVRRTGGLDPKNEARSYNAGASQAKGDVLVFLSPDALITNPDWLTELCAQVSKPDVGVAGGWQQYPDLRTQSAGFVLKDGCRGILECYRGLPASDIGHMGRAHLIQRYLAVSRHCLATRKSVFDSLNGLDAQSYPNHLWNVDYCLRVRFDAGRHCVWSPYAKIVIRELLVEKGEKSAELSHLKSHWGPMIPRDPYYNPNLDLDDPRSFLSWPPRSGN